MKTTFTKSDLRIFALVLSLLLALFSIKFCRHGNIASGGVLLGSSAAALLIGVFVPALIIPVYKLFMFVGGKIMAPAVTTMLLSIVFYCIITPISIILKVTRKDILGLKVDKAKNTYWVDREKRVVDVKTMENQY